MILELDKTTIDRISSYSLPSFAEIPDVGLYLNQVATYINRYLEPFLGFELTESMISNYVKKKLIANPQRKQYSREMIAYLIFIALCKSVATLDDIQLLIKLQKENNHTVEASYTFFRNEFESILSSVFGISKEEKREGESKSLEEELLCKLIVAIAHKIYVDMAFRMLEGKEKDGEEDKR